MHTIADLNTKFGIENRLHFKPGRGDLPCAELNSEFGTLEIYLLGAHVSSWKGNLGDERLFMSSRAQFVEATPIRGGIPIVFPQFGLGALPAHGFARTAIWEPLSARVLPSGGVELTLELPRTLEISALWPSQFQLTYTVRLESELTTVLDVSNPGDDILTFNAALHTYFQVSALAETFVTGLCGLTYLDSLAERRAVEEQDEMRGFVGAVDRIYKAAPNDISIEDRAGKRRFFIHKENLPDAVVWNPGAERAKAIADLGDEDFEKFVCVEPAAAASAIQLAPGARISLLQRIAVVAL